jgi:TrmH family RNA methyltransferase
MIARHITSKSNPLFKQLKELVNDNTAYREHHRIWIEGDHLCRAAFERGWKLDELVMGESQFERVKGDWTQAAERVTTLPDHLMSALCALGSSSWIGAVVKLPTNQVLQSHLPTVVLDRLQDPGNAGSILRSATAFGFKQIVTTPQTVALWSSKVVRSAMGAHFGVQLFESISTDTLMDLGLPILVTSSHQGQLLHDLVRRKSLPSPCLWVLGHEGQGASSVWFDKAFLKVKIEQPGGEESLNVAAAAAICLHASASQDTVTSSG